VPGNQVLVTITGSVIACGSTFRVYFSMCDEAPELPTTPCEAGAFCQPFGLSGFSCPTGAVEYCDTVPIDRYDSTQALAACQVCYGAPCYLEDADCAGLGYGPRPDGYYVCGDGYFGYENGCSGDAGRIWRICTSFTTYGRWAP
jgi:hypothetical protein